MRPAETAREPAKVAFGPTKRQLVKIMEREPLKIAKLYYANMKFTGSKRSQHREGLSSISCYLRARAYYGRTGPFARE